LYEENRSGEEASWLKKKFGKGDLGSDGNFKNYLIILLYCCRVVTDLAVRKFVTFVCDGGLGRQKTYSRLIL
jgi:hypothetical protein